MFRYVAGGRVDEGNDRSQRYVIFGSPYNRGIKPAVLLSLSYSCLGSSPFLCKDRRVKFIFCSIEAVGSLCSGVAQQCLNLPIIFISVKNDYSMTFICW